MAKRERSKETLYIKLYKEDCRIGGVLYGLEPIVLSTLLRLEAYVDKDGLVKEPYGKGYKINQLSVMINLGYRTLKKALSILQMRGLIKIDARGIITVKDYKYNNFTRFKYKSPYPAQIVRESVGIPEGGKND